MCFKFVCEACDRKLPYFCPSADSLNDISNLCRVNAHTQQSGFKCADCERLDGVTRRLEDWIRFHPGKKADLQGTKSSRTEVTVRERLVGEDPRSPWFTSSVTITNLRKALLASGTYRGSIEERLLDERIHRAETTPEDKEFQESGTHKIDHCCICLGNFTALPQWSSPSPTPAQDKPATSEGIPITKQSRSREPSNHHIKLPRRWSEQCDTQS